MEISHTNFTKVTWVVLVEVDTVVVLATGVTTTTGMLSVLSHTTMTVAHVASKLSGLAQSGWLSLRRF